MQKTLYLILVKEIANKETCQTFSHSTESPRSLKHYNRNITEDDNNYEDNCSSVFDVFNHSNYNDNIEVQKLRNALKVRNEKNVITKPNQLMRNFTVDTNGRIINSTIRAESGGKIFKPPVSSKLI